MPTYKKTEDGVNGCVFFFRIHDTNHVLIGTSTTNNPRMRYGQLSRLIPYRLDLIGWIRTGAFLGLHSRLTSEFANSSLLNGWYNLPPESLATILSRESGVDVSEVIDMVLKGAIVALDGGEVLAESEMGSVEKFLREGGYESASSDDGMEVLFRSAYREYVLGCEEQVSIGEFRRTVSNLGFRRTFDNSGFYAIVDGVGSKKWNEKGCKCE